MPDITMCSGEGCDQREGCYRFTARPSERQSYFSIVPVGADGTCDHFWYSGSKSAKADSVDPDSF